jgi:hypothetical protein
MKAERSEAFSNQVQRRIKVWANHNNKVGLPPKGPAKAERRNFNYVF